MDLSEAAAWQRTMWASKGAANVGLCLPERPANVGPRG